MSRFVSVLEVRLERMLEQLGRPKPHFDDPSIERREVGMIVEVLEELVNIHSLPCITPEDDAWARQASKQELMQEEYSRLNLSRSAAADRELTRRGVMERYT